MPSLTRRPPLPRGKIRSAFDLVKAQLRKEGTILHRYVATWQLGEDSSDVDQVGPDNWSLEMLPLIRLDLAGGMSVQHNTHQLKADVDYNVTIAIDGLNQGEAADVWEVFQAALYPQDKSLYGKLHALGVLSYTVRLIGVAPQQFPWGRGQIVKGSLRLPHVLPMMV